MKVRVYGSQKDEYAFYESAKETSGFSFTFASEVLSMETVHLTLGFDAIIIVTTCKITSEVAQALYKNGVRFIAARSAGTDHIDYDAARATGLLAANVPFYSPGAIAEHTLMTALNLLRRSKREAGMIASGDFSMSGLKGRQLSGMTAGVFGTGRIGLRTMQLLSGFGCRILAYDLYPGEQAKAYCEYREPEYLLRESDILFFHCPLTEQNYHMINRDSIAKMKDGVYIVNAARGGLIDGRAVLEALQAGKVAGFGFDVYENEQAFLRKNIGPDTIEDEVFRQLLLCENAYYTAHIAFYTDAAIKNMIQVSIDNLKEYKLTGKCRNELKKA